MVSPRIVRVESADGQSTQLNFCCFGSFALVTGNDAALTTARRAGREFIEYLVAHPRATVARERLIDALWPDVDAEAGAHRLHVAVSGARSALRRYVADCDPIRCTVNGYAWHPSIDVRTDVERFETCYALGSLDAYREAAVLYTGDFLAGESADWIVRRRLALASRLVTMLQRLAAAALERDDYEAAMAHAARLVALDRAHEEATRLMMRCLARMGQRSFALTEYALLCDYLKRYIGVQPTRETAALRERIARGEVD
jgi:DNA-binding SARP family transcriptional activator